MGKERQQAACRAGRAAAFTSLDPGVGPLGPPVPSPERLAVLSLTVAMASSSVNPCYLALCSHTEKGSALLGLMTLPSCCLSPIIGQRKGGQKMVMRHFAFPWASAARGQLVTSKSMPSNV